MAKQPELYRIPPKPGYLGAYNWRATTLGLLLLAAVNFGATQYIAARFQYQPALGPPLLQMRGGGIYEPFSWVIWGWRYCTSQDMRIRRPFFEGEMIVFAGSFLCIGLFFAVTNRHTRKLTENADHLHGSARWASADDIRETGLLATKGGVYVGGWRPKGEDRLRYLRHDGPEHLLAFAPTRSGKGVGLVIPSLLAWSESAVIYDIKGENWAKTAGFRAQQGHLCFKFSPVEDKASSRFNPLGEVRLFTLRDVSDAQNIANMIVRTGEDSPQERYWQDAAASITTGMILHVCYEAAVGGTRRLSRRSCPCVHAAGYEFPRNTGRAAQFRARPGLTSTAGGCPPVSGQSRTPWCARRCRRCSTRKRKTSAVCSPRRRRR